MFLLLHYSYSLIKKILQYKRIHNDPLAIFCFHELSNWKRNALLQYAYMIPDSVYFVQYNSKVNTPNIPKYIKNWENRESSDKTLVGIFDPLVLIPELVESLLELNISLRLNDVKCKPKIEGKNPNPALKLKLEPPDDWLEEWELEFEFEFCPELKLLGGKLNE